MTKDAGKSGTSRSRRKHAWIRDHNKCIAATNFKELKQPQAAWKSVIRECAQNEAKKLASDTPTEAKHQTILSPVDYVKNPVTVSVQAKQAIEQALLNYSDEFFKILATVSLANQRTEPQAADLAMAKFVVECRANKTNWRRTQFTDAYLQSCFEHAVDREKLRYGEVGYVLLGPRLKRLEQKSKPEGAPTKAQMKAFKKAHGVSTKQVKDHVHTVLQQGSAMESTKQKKTPWVNLTRELIQDCMDTIVSDQEHAMENQITQAAMTDSVHKRLTSVEGIAGVSSKHKSISQHAVRALCEASLDYLHQYFVYMNTVAAIRKSTVIKEVDHAVAMLALNQKGMCWQKSGFSELFLTENGVKVKPLNSNRPSSRARKQARPKKRDVVDFTKFL